MIRRINFSSTYFLLFIICLLGLYLRLLNLPSTMHFIGDQAWFYLSARDALLNGHFPLLGITSSVTWLHQGPLWTYLLIPPLGLFSFNPVSGGIFSSVVGTLTIVMCYFLARLWFDTRSGLVASFIFAVSPLTIIHARMPYHTSVIPFFMAACFLFLYRRQYFWANLFLGFLYQLELVTVILWPVYIFFLWRSKYTPQPMHVLGFLLGILPFILAGPIQTCGVFIWAGYHFLSKHVTSPLPLDFYFRLIDRFFLPAYPMVSSFILSLSVLFAMIRRRIYVLWLIVPILFITLNGVASEAYFTLLMLPLSLFAGYLISSIFRGRLLVVFMAFWWILNAYFLLSRNFLIDPQSYGASLASRVQLSRDIFDLSVTSTPRLQMVGPGSQFASTEDPYVYLLWWFGRFGESFGKYYRFQINDATQTFSVIQ